VGSIQNELNNFLTKPMGNHFRLTNVIPERIIFISRGITVCELLYGQVWTYCGCKDVDR